MSCRFNGVAKLFGLYFGLIFAIIGFQFVHRSIEKSRLVMVLALTITLYYTGLVLVKVLQLRVPFMMMVNVLFGTLASLISMFIISPLIGWTYMGLFMFFIIVFLCFKKKNEISRWIKKCFARLHHKGGDSDMSHTSELHGIETLDV